MSWVFPLHRPQWQRLSYVLFAMSTVLGAGLFGVNLGLFLQVYVAKSYFLLGRRTAIALVGLTAIPWAFNEYARESHQLQASSGLDSIDPIRFAIFTLAIYAAASFFTLMLSQMVVIQQKKDQKIEELSEQVESLAATLERTRIAREIHDSLGHTLTNLDTQLAVAQTLRSHNPTQAFEAVDTAKQLARQCIEDVSQALSRMRESDFDLNQALIALIEQLRQTSTLKVEWKVNLPNLPVYQSYQIYCLVKEALMNVQKHAKASRVQFSAHQTDRGIAIDLVDDGIGFNKTAFTPGFGLQGMIERVQLLGGQFDLQTEAAQGTQIHITLPL
ncbi:sensor histidine kinase [Microcoleus sp. FACHB-1515]|uniref:sensor histidine kinase n=1 Tax=Cyanophyceae TaxID=3028117 RepID=UPI001684059F|nr:sensor histidine kinase [Microcoleus sp. FACHB-1515]MBD2091828.1 sensor histidine kinase [Microcoleus sp. FACHB-1515]